MNKDKDLKADRARYVQNTVNSSKKSSTAVNKLAKELFLSPQTIYDDLKKPLD